MVQLSHSIHPPLDGRSWTVPQCMYKMYIQEGLKNACNQLSARISESDLVHIFTNSFTEAEPYPFVCCCLWLLSRHDSIESHCDKKPTDNQVQNIYSLSYAEVARLCHRALTSEQSTSTLLISSPLFPVCFPLLSKVISHFSKVCFIPLHFHARPTLISDCFQ